jgi:hypothetical protein
VRPLPALGYFLAASPILRNGAQPGPPEERLERTDRGSLKSTCVILRRPVARLAAPSLRAARLGDDGGAE